MQDFDCRDLTLALLRGGPAADDALLQIGGLNEQAFLDYLVSQHMAGSIGIIIESNPLASMLSPSLRKELAKSALIQGRHNAHVHETVLSVNELLHANGIPVINLKGSYYAYRYWGGLNHRFLWDVDILIPADELERAIALLGTKGYRYQSGSMGNNRLTQMFSHAVTLVGTGPELDLHYVFRTRPGYRIDYTAIWEAAVEHSLGGATLQVLSAEHDLMFLMLAVAHDLEGSKLKFKLLIDLIYALESVDPQMDWAGFFARRKTENLEKLCLNVCVLALNCIGMHFDLPRLSAYLLNPISRASDMGKERIQRLLSNPRNSLENRLWFASISPVGRPRYLLWWLLTWPFRFALGNKI